LLGQINAPHAALAEQLHDFVPPREHLPDERIGRLDFGQGRSAARAERLRFDDRGLASGTVHRRRWVVERPSTIIDDAARRFDLGAPRVYETSTTNGFRERFEV
jgi:hypothetical protein